MNVTYEYFLDNAHIQLKSSISKIKKRKNELAINSGGQGCASKKF